MPGCTSATRTAPTGPSGDAATAIAIAISAPSDDRHRAFAIETAIRSRRVLPIAASVALYEASSCIRRDSDLGDDHQPEQRRQRGERLERQHLGVGGVLDFRADRRGPFEGDRLVR